MSLKQWLCAHRDTYRFRADTGLLSLRCWACGWEAPFGLQDTPTANLEPSKAIPKAKRAPRVQRPAVVRFPKVVNK